MKAEAAERKAKAAAPSKRKREAAALVAQHAALVAVADAIPKVLIQGFWGGTAAAAKCDELLIRNCFAPQLGVQSCGIRLLLAVHLMCTRVVKQRCSNRPHDRPVWCDVRCSWRRWWQSSRRRSMPSGRRWAHMRRSPLSTA